MFTDGDGRLRVQRRGDVHFDTVLYDGPGGLGIEWYFRGTSRLGANVMLYHLEPGAAEGEHHHADGDPEACSALDQDELYVAVVGEVVVTAGAEHVVLRAGDAVYVPFGVRHGVHNASTEPAEVVLLFGAARTGDRSEDG